MKYVWTCTWASLLAETDMSNTLLCVCVFGSRYWHYMCVLGCGCRELMHWWNRAQEAASSLLSSLLSFITPSPHPTSSTSLLLLLSLSLSPSISATIALSAIWSPKHFTPHPISLSSSLCLSVSPSPSCLPSPAGCCGQTSRSDLSLPSSLLLFLCLSFPPSIDSTFPVLCCYSQISVSACLARFIFVISSSCFC